VPGVLKFYTRPIPDAIAGIVGRCQDNRGKSFPKISTGMYRLFLLGGF